MTKNEGIDIYTVQREALLLLRSSIREIETVFFISLKNAFRERDEIEVGRKDKGEGVEVVSSIDVGGGLVRKEWELGLVEVELRTVANLRFYLAPFAYFSLFFSLCFPAYFFFASLRNSAIFQRRSYTLSTPSRNLKFIAGCRPVGESRICTEMREKKKEKPEN